MPIRIEELRSDNLVWKIKEHPCEAFGRRGTSVSIMVGDEIELPVAFLDTDKNAIGFIQAIKKAGITRE